MEYSSREKNKHFLGILFENEVFRAYLLIILEIGGRFFYFWKKIIIREIWRIIKNKILYVKFFFKYFVILFFYKYFILKHFPIPPFFRSPTLISDSPIEWLGSTLQRSDVVNQVKSLGSTFLDSDVAKSQWKPEVYEGIFTGEDPRQRRQNILPSSIPKLSRVSLRLTQPCTEPQLHDSGLSRLVATLFIRNPDHLVFLFACWENKENKMKTFGCYEKWKDQCSWCDFLFLHFLRDQTGRSYLFVFFTDLILYELLCLIFWSDWCISI